VHLRDCDRSRRGTPVVIITEQNVYQCPIVGRPRLHKVAQYDVSYVAASIQNYIAVTHFASRPAACPMSPWTPRDAPSSHLLTSAGRLRGRSTREGRREGDDYFQAIHNCGKPIQGDKLSEDLHNADSNSSLAEGASARTMGKG
jgi:hypothetical protein